MIWDAMLLLGLLAFGFGLVLSYAAMRFKVEGNPVVEQVETVLPQLQCGKCGYAGCRPYAEAVVRGEARINQCPPGGESGMLALADLLDQTPQTFQAEQPKLRAVIDEVQCIGCTKCIQICPVDAIVGAPKHMHTVIEQECTGCELCVAPCPVDCIQMVKIPVNVQTWKWPYPVFPIQVEQQVN